METLLSTVLDILIYALTGLVASWYYFHRKRRDLLGGFYGAAIIGTVGSVIVTYFASTWSIVLLNWMMNPKKIYGGVMLRVNLLAAIVGAFVFVYILNRINHDRERK